MSKEFWVFGYGSLMWNPGFAHSERCAAELADHTRSFCLASVRYRGTPENPGLVLALEPKPGAKCQGVGFYVPHDHADEARAYLRHREMVTSSYLERTLPLYLPEKRQNVAALCYVMDLEHEQYCGHLSIEERAEIIARSHGPAGPNHDYLFNTLAHLREFGVEDTEMEAIATLVRDHLQKAQISP